MNDRERSPQAIVVSYPLNLSHHLSKLSVKHLLSIESAPDQKSLACPVLVNDPAVALKAPLVHSF